MHSAISASGLAEPEHQAALGEHRRPVRLGVREHGQCLLVAGAWIAHRMRQAAHGLDVLREHVEPGIDHQFDVAQHALKVGRQGFHCGVGRTLLDGAHAGCVMSRTAVLQIVAIDRSEHDVLELHKRDAGGDIARLLGVQPAVRIAGIDGAEPAGTRADLAHHHDGGGAGIPTLADIRALGLFAHRGQAMLAHGLAHGVVARRLPPAAP